MQTHNSNPAEAILKMEKVSVVSSKMIGKVLLDSVQWTVRPGEFWVVASWPGVGKTDLLLTAAGLNRPVEGKVWLFGRNLVTLQEDELIQTRLRIGFVFEHGGRLFNNLTVLENLTLPYSYHHNSSFGVSSTKVAAILERTGLKPYANMAPGSMMRGLRQRVALARALVLEPEFLLLDNPIASIDPREAQWWLSFLRQLRRDSKSPLAIVVTTDDLRPWASEGEQFAYLRNKSFVPVGNREDLASSEDPILKMLLAEKMAPDTSPPFEELNF